MKDIPMRNLKLLLATAAFAIVVGISNVKAETQNGFTCDRIAGNKVCTANLISGTLTVAGPLRVENCDKNLSLYRQSTAATNTLTSIAVGPDTTVSITVAPSTSATTVASRTDIVTGGQCYVWAAITPASGATETTRIKVVEGKNTTTNFQ